MGEDKLIVPSPANPLAVARMFVNTHYIDQQDTTLIRSHRNTFHVYGGTSWPEIEDRRLEADLYRWLEDAWYWKKTAKDEELVEFEPSRRKMGDLIEALAALTHLDAKVTPPTWLGMDGPDVMPFANGLLDLTTRELRSHTPTFFSFHVMPFSYDAAAPAPTRWLTFLEQLWPEDVESRETLAEIMGYVLAGGTALQKVALLVGPKRSGKGTIGRVMTGLLGAHNVAAPTLSSLTTNFGLSPLIGKPLALISDARLGTRIDASIAVERLLSISGEDSLTIDRKYRDPWTGRLPTRFVILTNEVPRFADASGALASRFVPLVLTNSFYGHEDPALTDKLLEEAPGILNWCLDGLDRLRERGYFEQPASARDAIRRLEDLASPVGAFVRDRCNVDVLLEVDKDALWNEWKAWCEAEGRDRPGTKAVFARDLIAAYPSVKARRPKREGERVHVYEGIGVRGPGDDDEPEDESSRPREDRDSEQQSVEPLTTRDTPPAVMDETATHIEQDRRSVPVVTGGQGSSAMYVSHDVGSSIPPGTLIRQVGGLKTRRYWVKATTNGSVDAWELERGGAAGKLRTFRVADVIVVEAADA